LLRDPLVDISKLSARLPPRPLTRFAPAPTGWLHLGHVLNAEYVWGAARALDGRVLLRIEDHDRERCRSEFEAGILDDLDWLGFVPDIHTTAEFRAGTCAGRQSDRGAMYDAAAAILRNAGLLFGCACSRREIVGQNDTSTPSPELRYSGRCRDRGLPLDARHGWRVRIEPGVERFNDARLGEQAHDPAAQCGDLLIRDRHGNWTYQFAVVVDDWRQQIDLVIRGEDLLPSTGRQIRLARLLGRNDPPVFLHHPLIMKSASQKLSKSDRDSGVRDLRRQGMSPADVRKKARDAARLTGS
jgi:glutamyl-tRNA synthetase/glutamyl-Q tRNA(Asp) synthetase